MKIGRITKILSIFALSLVLTMGKVPLKPLVSMVMADEPKSVTYNPDNEWTGTLDIEESCTIVLQNINHVNTGTDGSAIKISNKAEVCLFLEGNNTLSGNKDVQSAGIEVEEGSTVNIYGEENASLTVTGGKYGAGIGGAGFDKASTGNSLAGKINIYSGSIKAVGGDKGAGIGSGNHQSCSEINIFGGNITAIGTAYGAGIGSGFGTAGGATGAPQVGYYDGGNITIKGGVVRAASYDVNFDLFDMYNPDTLYGEGYQNSRAAGIGGGYAASSGHIVIEGNAEVIAIGSCGGTGIGSGRGTTKIANYYPESVGCDITICGNAKVVAMATQDKESNVGKIGGAGIGLGRGWNLEEDNDKGTICISDNASVYAYADGGASGIGGSACVGKFTNFGDVMDVPAAAKLKSLTVKPTATVVAIGNKVETGLFCDAIGFVESDNHQSDFLRLKATEEFYTSRNDFFTDEKFPIKVDAVDADNTNKCISFSLAGPSFSEIMVHIPDTEKYNFPIKDYLAPNDRSIFLANSVVSNSAEFITKENSISDYELTNITAGLDREARFISSYGELSVWIDADKGVFEYGASFFADVCDVTTASSLYSKIDEGDYKDHLSAVLFFKAGVKDVDGIVYDEFGKQLVKYFVQIPSGWDTHDLIALKPMQGDDVDFSDSQKITEINGVKYLSFEADCSGNFAIIKLKKDPEVEAPKAVLQEYNGSAQALITAGSTSGGTMHYAVTDAATAPDKSAYSKAIPKKTEAGTYYVWYKVVGDVDYDDVEAESIPITIAKKPLTITADSDSKIYDGDELTKSSYSISENGLVKDHKISKVTITGTQTTAGCSDNVPSGAVIKNGDTDVTDNYDISYVPGTLTVTKATPAVTSPTANILIYNGNEQELVTAGAANFGKVLYSLDGKKYSEEIAKGTDAGDYIVYYKVEGTDNWNAVEAASVNVTIKKATPSYDKPDDKEITCMQTLKDINLPKGFAYANIDQELSIGENEVELTFTPEDTDNYEVINDIIIKVTTYHTFDKEIAEEKYLKSAATCTDKAVYYKSCECGEKGTDTFEYGEALGHDYADVTYTWSDDGKTCTAKTICTRKECTDDTVGHTVTERVQSTGKETKAATCEEKGITTYTATFENKLFETQTKEVADIREKGHISSEAVKENVVAETCEEEGNYDEVVYCSECNKELSREEKTIPAKGHIYGITTYTWSEDGKSCTATSVCSNDSTHKITETATYEPDKADSQIKATVKEAATTEKMGTTTYTATFKNAEMFKVQTKDVVDIPKVEVTDNPSDNPSDKPTDKPSDNPSKQEDTTKPADTTKPSDTTKTDGNTSSNDTTKDTSVTPAPKEEGAKLPVTDTKAEYVVNSKAGEEPAVEYKPAADTKEKTVTVPESVTVDGVTYAVNEIADNAFKGNKTVESVVIPKSVKEIGDSAFSGCTKLKSVTIPGSVTEIGDNAFSGCTNLKSVKIPESVTEIGDKAFSGCKKLNSVTIGKNVAEIGDSAFANCSALTKATLPANVTKLGSNIFKGCKKLKTITIKTTKLTSKNIAKNAFKGIGNKVTIKVPKKMKKAYTKLFRKKGLSKKIKIK